MMYKVTIGWLALSLVLCLVPSPISAAKDGARLLECIRSDGKSFSFTAKYNLIELTDDDFRIGIDIKCRHTITDENGPLGELDVQFSIPADPSKPNGK